MKQESQVIILGDKFREILNIISLDFVEMSKHRCELHVEESFPLTLDVSLDAPQTSAPTTSNSDLSKKRDIEG